MSDQTILVIRATGTQGVAVLKNAQKHGIKARAYVRNAQDERAKALLKYDAELYEGNLEEAHALEKALGGCTGIFLNQIPSFTDDGETRDARLILSLARQAGIKHVVHSTGMGVARADSVDDTVKAALVGKAEVEKLVKASGMNWTILRGGYFDTNFIGFPSRFMFPELGPKKEFVCSFKPDTLLPLVDPYDIGAFAIAAFMNPSRFQGSTIPIAAEKRTIKQIVEDLRLASGHDIQAIYRTDEETEELAKTNPLIAGSIATRNLHEMADIDGVRKWGVKLHTLPEFLANKKDEVQETFAMTGSGVQLQFQ